MVVIAAFKSENIAWSVLLALSRETSEAKRTLSDVKLEVTLVQECDSGIGRLTSHVYDVQYVVVLSSLVDG